MGMKPCPFCGDTHIHTRSYERLLEGMKWQIGCNKCNCYGCVAYSRVFATEEEAIEAWNRRENEKRLEEELDSAKRYLGYMADGIKESMTPDDEKIAHLQIALDKANEKLAYLCDDPPYYDDGCGREQLKAWMSAWRFEAMMEGRKTLGELIKKGDYYECSKCGNVVREKTRFCPHCGVIIIERGKNAT